MIPDFSPKMLRGFVYARIQMAGYRVTFPDSRKSLRRPTLTFDQACAGERARIMKRAHVTDEQIDRVLLGQVISLAQRERLWRALGADPAEYGVRLVGASGQEALQ